MKKANKSKTSEPTISDAVNAVQKLSGKFDNLSGAVQDLTEAVQVGFERHEKVLKALVEGQEQLRESVGILDQRVSKTQSRIEDVVDENRDAVLNHERRIRHLERTRG